MAKVTVANLKCEARYVDNTRPQAMMSHQAVASMLAWMGSSYLVLDGYGAEVEVRDVFRAWLEDTHCEQADVEHYAMGGMDFHFNTNNDVDYGDGHFGI